MVAALRPIYSLTDSTPARTILVYRNGDPFFMGKKFVLNHRYVPNFEALMIQLNESVSTPFGVRNIYTPQYGHSVVDMDSFQQGGRYVVAGRERFKKIDYFNIGTTKPQARRRHEVILPVVHSTIQVPSKWHSVYNKPRNIYVFTNGDILIQPMKILIPKFTLNNWNRVLGLINEKVIPRSGGIQRLYTLRGQLVHGSDELEDNQYYVACGTEKFKALPYWKNPRVPAYTQQYSKPIAPPYKPEKEMVRLPPSIEPSKYPRPVEVGRGDIPSVYLAKPKKASPEKAPTTLSSDDGRSVYKAGRRRAETRGARDIPEDKNVKVDVPVEQAPAEIVQDEDIYYNQEAVEEEAPGEIVQDEDTFYSPGEGKAPAEIVQDEDVYYSPGKGKGGCWKRNQGVQTAWLPELSTTQRRKLHRQFTNRKQAPPETVSHETVHFIAETDEIKAPAATDNDEDVYDNDEKEEIQRWRQEKPKGTTSPDVRKSSALLDVRASAEEYEDDDVYSYVDDRGEKDYSSSSEDTTSPQRVSRTEDMREEQPAAPEMASDEELHFTSDTDERKPKKKTRSFKKFFDFIFHSKKKDANKDT